MSLQKQANVSQYRDWLSPIGAIFNSGSSGTNTNRSGSGLIQLFIPNSVSFANFGNYVYNANSIEKIHIWECGEAVSIALYSSSSITSSQAAAVMTTSNTTSGSIYAGIAGAYIDPESTNTTVDAEVDGRLYGIAATGVPIGGGSRSSWNGIPGQQMSFEMIWMTPSIYTGLHGDFLSHGIGFGLRVLPNQNKAVYYVPGTDQKRYMTLINPNSMGLPTYSPRGFLPATPLYYFDGTSDVGAPGNGRFLGRLREIEAIKSAPSGMTYRSGSVDYGYTLGGSTNFATQAILFRTGV